MEKWKSVPLPGWKRGLLTGLLGLMLTLAAWGVRTARQEAAALTATAPAAAEDGTAPGSASGEEKKRIALTFDDGPHPTCTAELLDGLKERGVQATFFLLGSNLAGNEAVVARMAKEGHLIGNHTFSHVDISQLSLTDACAEIEETSAAITAITGEPVEFVRPPYGNWSEALERKVSLIPVFWTVDTLDWQRRDADRIVAAVLDEVEENDIILMHDAYESTVEAALRLIDALQAQGYEFVTADELILE